MKCIGNRYRGLCLSCVRSATKTESRIQTSTKNNPSTVDVYGSVGIDEKGLTYLKFDYLIERAVSQVEVSEQSGCSVACMHGETCPLRF